MSNEMHQIKKFMTETPYAVNSEACLQEAIDLMRKHNIRHLPVIKQGRPFGIITDRDLKSLMSFAGVDPKHMHIGDVCSDEPYMATPDTSLKEVASMMAKKRFGSALVVQNNKLLGIFTAINACEAISSILE